MQYFFSSTQIEQILQLIDAGPAREAHVKALVTLHAVCCPCSNH